MPPSAVTRLARLRRVGSGRLALVAELGDRGGALPTRINRLSVEGNDVAMLHCRRGAAESCLRCGLGHGAMNRCHRDVDTALDGMHGRHRAWAKAHRRGWLACTGDERLRSSQYQEHDERLRSSQYQEHDENCQAAHEINCSVAGSSRIPLSTTVERCQGWGYSYRSMSAMRICEAREAGAMVAIVAMTTTATSITTNAAGSNTKSAGITHWPKARTKR